MEMAPRCSLATAFLCSALSTLLWVLLFSPFLRHVPHMLARITISMNATQRERDRAGETGRAESLPDGDGELLQGKTIDFGFTLRVCPLCAPTVASHSHAAVGRGGASMRCCGGGRRRDPLRERTDGWAWACERAMSSGQKMQLPFFE